MEVLRSHLFEVPLQLTLLSVSIIKKETKNAFLNRRLALLLLFGFMPSLVSSGIVIPESIHSFIKKHCYRCHGEDTQEADLSLHALTAPFWSWLTPSTTAAVRSYGTKAFASFQWRNNMEQKNPVLL